MACPAPAELVARLTRALLHVGRHGPRHCGDVHVGHLGAQGDLPEVSRAAAVAAPVPGVLLPEEHGPAPLQLWHLLPEHEAQGRGEPWLSQVPPPPPPLLHLLIEEPLEPAVLLLQGQPAPAQEQELVLIGVVPDLHLLHVPVRTPLGVVVAELDLVDDTQVGGLDDERVRLGSPDGGTGWRCTPLLPTATPTVQYLLPPSAWAEQTFLAGSPPGTSP